MDFLSLVLSLNHDNSTGSYSDPSFLRIEKQFAVWCICEVPSCWSMSVAPFGSYGLLISPEP